MKSFSHKSVEINDKFWSPWLNTHKDVTLKHVMCKLKETGHLENFQIAAGKTKGGFSGRVFSDSDVYKWLEGASNTLATYSDSELQKQVDEIISLIEGAQEEDGYLNTYFTIVEPDKKWTNLGLMHELYCAGHLFQAAAVHYKATGHENLLKIACDFADHITRVFGPGRKIGYPGHEEVELGLIELYRVTDKRKYLDLAKFFLDQRGKGKSVFKKELDNLDSIAGTKTGKRAYRELFTNGRFDGRYAQDHKPVREQEKAVGHAVRATYLYSAMADLAMENVDEDLINALEKIWENVVSRRMYITGGIGSSYKNEGFTQDYDLPNLTSYAETCAAVGNIMWNFRMLQLTGERRFADLMERVLYNGFLAGLSLKGNKFFYVNPLAMKGDGHPLQCVDERFTNERQEWFRTSCCPTNIVRFLPSLSRYIYLRSNSEIFVNLYIGSKLEAFLQGRKVILVQETNYPWDGDISISISVNSPIKFSLFCRIPKCCREAKLSLNGDNVDIDSLLQKGYVKLDRVWTNGDRVKLHLDLPIETIASHPQVTNNLGRVALQRGPLIYCLEEVDNFSGLEQAKLPKDPKLSAKFIPELLGGVEVIEGEILLPDSSVWNSTLYQPVNNTRFHRKTFRAIPYYAWGNRRPGEMRVWIRSEGT